MNSKLLIESFTSNYNEVALLAVDKMANNFNFEKAETMVSLFEMESDVEKFHEFMTGFVEYKLEESQSSNDKSFTPTDTIVEKCNEFIKTLHQEKEEKYKQIPNFIKGYLEAIELHDKRVSEYQERLQSIGTDVDLMLSIENMCESHISYLTDKFTERMDWIVQASGYNTQQALFGKKEPKNTPVFT